MASHPSIATHEDSGLGQVTSLSVSMITCKMEIISLLQDHARNWVSWVENTHSSLFTTALFAIVKRWTQPNVH